MFRYCDFLLGDNDSIVIVVPTQLPKDQPLSIEVQRAGLVFKSGDQPLTTIRCEKSEVLKRLMNAGRVGLVEFLHGLPKLPSYITAVADIEVNLELEAA
ncbi:MAG: hypothetical protein GC136_02140 [Alphaproteobacteria bacterium]|nr:hypothetical protein [Alphaproteobacteria bacterium]